MQSIEDIVVKHNKAFRIFKDCKTRLRRSKMKYNKVLQEWLNNSETCHYLFGSNIKLTSWKDLAKYNYTDRNFSQIKLRLSTLPIIRELFNAGKELLHARCAYWQWREIYMDSYNKSIDYAKYIANKYDLEGIIRENEELDNINIDDIIPVSDSENSDRSDNDESDSDSMNDIINYIGGAVDDPISRMDNTDIKNLILLSKRDKIKVFIQTPSLGEQQVMKILDKFTCNNNIMYIYSFRFPFCINVFPLEIDFFGVIRHKHHIFYWAIEYDGDQHYNEENSFFKYENIHRNDVLRQYYLSQMGIHLLRITTKTGNIKKEIATFFETISTTDKYVICNQIVPNKKYFTCKQDHRGLSFFNKYYDDHIQINTLDCDESHLSEKNTERFERIYMRYASNNMNDIALPNRKCFGRKKNNNVVIL